MFDASLLSLYMQGPRTKHFGATKWVLRYIRGTTDYGIWYRSLENGAFIGYTDSNYGGYLDDYKRKSSYSFFSFREFPLRV